MLSDKNTSFHLDNVDDVNKQKIYVKPQLEELGDLRSLTLGASCGPGESSDGFDPMTTADPFFC